MNARPDDRRLGCGRDIDELWSQMSRPPDQHETTCAFCQEARASMEPLARATGLMRTEEVEDPGRVPDPGVLARVMEVARAEVRRSRLLPLDHPEPDDPAPELTISEQTVAAVARRAADGVSGVQVRRSRVALARREADGEITTSTTAGASRDARRPADVRISLQVSVALTVAIPQTMQAVRDAVMTAITEEVGVNPVVVDIAVQDVHDV